MLLLKTRKFFKSLNNFPWKLIIYFDPQFSEFSLNEFSFMGNLTIFANQIFPPNRKNFSR